jgi:hypothetical protein
MVAAFGASTWLFLAFIGWLPGVLSRHNKGMLALSTRIVVPGGLAAAVSACLSCGARRLPPPFAPCALSAATAQSRLEISGRPFEGELAVTNVFDHDVPIPGVFHASYGHLDRIDVAVGDTVRPEWPAQHRAGAAWLNASAAL